MSARLQPALLIFLFASLTGSALAACPPNPVDGTTLHNGTLQLAWRPVLKAGPIQPTAIPQGQHFSIEVQLCGGTPPASATLIRIDATMPEHKHGMNYRPRISALGDGRYRADGLMFHMSGRWQLEFEVSSADGTSRLLDDVRIR